MTSITVTMLKLVPRAFAKVPFHQATFKSKNGFKLVNDTDCVPDPQANSVKCNFTGPLEITKEADLAPLIDCTEIKAQGTGILS